MSADNCTDCGSTRSVGLERTHYFPRQLVTPDDLTQDQVYFREKLRRHNCMLHGWGIVCGLRVAVKSDCQVVVEAGYALGPQGDEIIVPDDVLVDICQVDSNGNAVGPCADVDPWCSDVTVANEPGKPVYVAIRYEECNTRPVRVFSDRCGSGDAGCEYSRIRDSFVIAALHTLPDSYAAKNDATLLLTNQKAGTSLVGFAALAELQPIFKVLDARLTGPCVDCPCEPWIILAEVTPQQGQTPAIDCDKYRRQVFSLGIATDLLYNIHQQQSATSGKSASPVKDSFAGPIATDSSHVVAMRRTDGSVAALSVNMEIQPGDTFESLLKREGQRSVTDPQTGATYSLAELYASVSVDPTAPVSGIDAALLPLDGKPLNVDNLRATQSTLGSVLNAGGVSRLQDTYLGAPSQALNLPATDLKGADTASKLNQILAKQNLSIDQVANLDHSAFLARVLKGSKATDRAALTAEADVRWAQAQRIKNLVTF